MPLESRRWYPALVFSLTTVLGVAVSWWDAFFPSLTGDGYLVTDSLSNTYLWLGGILGALIGVYLAGRRPSMTRMVVGAIAVCILGGVVPFTSCRPAPRSPLFDQVFNHGADDTAAELAEWNAWEERKGALDDQHVLISTGAIVLFLMATSSLVTRRIVRKASDDGPPRTKWSL